MTAERDLTVERRAIEELPFLFMRRKVAPADISIALGEMFGAVFQHATSKGIAFAGPPTARYQNMGVESLTIEAGMPVVGSAQGEGEIEAGLLLGGDVATVFHKGPYDQIGQAHQAIERWLGEHKIEPIGPPWETYVTDPTEVPNPADWLTEVNWPIG